MSSVKDPKDDVSFAETAMQLAGKTEEESKRTGAVDKTDDEVDSFFAEQYKTSNSPVHKAIWNAKVPVELFSTPKLDTSLDLPAMKKSLAVLAEHKKTAPCSMSAAKFPIKFSKTFPKPDTGACSLSRSMVVKVPALVSS